MRRLVLANQKGGVGKTTTALNLSAGLAELGKRVLAIDLDPQANLTFAALGQGMAEATTYDLLLGEYKAREVIVSIERLGFDLAPSDIDLAAAEIELISAVGGQTRLRTRLNAEPLEYDFIVIDAPPSLGLLTINGLAAAGEVIIPVNTSVFALKGIVQLEETIEQVRQNLDRSDLRIGGVLANIVDHTNASADVIAAIRDRYGELAFETVVPKNIKIEEAHSRAETVLTYAPSSKGAAAYRQLAEEVVSRG